MTIETYDGVGNRWDAEGRLIQRATGPFAAEGELYERAVTGTGGERGGR